MATEPALEVRPMLPRFRDRPQADCAICAGRGQQRSGRRRSAWWCKDQGQDRAGMAGKGWQFLAGVAIPQTDDPLGTTAGYQPTAGAKGHIAQKVLMPAQLQVGLAVVRFMLV